MRILGIDPGLDGGFVLLDGPQVVERCVMPVVPVGRKRRIDERALVAWLRLRIDGSVRAYLELVHAMPKQGLASTFEFGSGWGFVRGVLAALDVPYELVRPQEWQRALLLGQPPGSEYLVASRMWPELDWRATPRCRTPHSGLVDAALIAEYGRRRSAA